MTRDDSEKLEVKLLVAGLSFFSLSAIVDGFMKSKDGWLFYVHLVLIASSVLCYLASVTVFLLGLTRR